METWDIVAYGAAPAVTTPAIPKACDPSLSPTITAEVHYSDLQRVPVYIFAVRGSDFTPGSTISYSFDGKTLAGKTDTVAADGTIRQLFAVASSTISASPPVFSNVYTMTVRDSHGCTFTRSFTIISSAKAAAAAKSVKYQELAVITGGVGVVEGGVATVGGLGFLGVGLKKPAVVAGVATAALIAGLTSFWAWHESNDYSKIANDPADPNYRRVVTLAKLTQRLPGLQGLSSSQQQTVRAFFDNVGQDALQLDALVTTLNRAATARKAGALGCAVLQHRAAIRYAQAADTLEAKQPAILRRINALLTSNHIGTVASSAKLFQRAMSSYAKHGIDSHLLKAWSTTFGAARSGQVAAAADVQARSMKQTTTAFSLAEGATALGHESQNSLAGVVSSSAGAALKADPATCK